MGRCLCIDLQLTLSNKKRWQYPLSVILEQCHPSSLVVITYTTIKGSLTSLFLMGKEKELDWAIQCIISLHVFDK